jgi:hypothetical protein
MIKIATSLRIHLDISSPIIDSVAVARLKTCGGEDFSPSNQITGL